MRRIAYILSSLVDARDYLHECYSSQTRFYAAIRCLYEAHIHLLFAPCRVCIRKDTYGK